MSASLDRFDFYPLRSRSAPSKLFTYTVSDHVPSFIVVTKERREKTLPRGSLSLSLSRRTWLRGALNETTSVCVLLFALYIVIMPSYRILLHIILSIITHENTSDTYGFYFIFENTKNTVCRDNTFSRSSISNVSSYTICKSHLTSSRVLSVPASRAPIHRFE